MSRVIANGLTRVLFAEGVDGVADVEAGASRAEVDAAVDLTDYLVSFDSSATGNTVPTPNFGTKFEESIQGTYSATVSAEFYRDDTNDLAWDTLPRGTYGYFIIQRFGDVESKAQEVWPVQVTSRSAVALASNESQRFSIDCAVPETPNEDDTVPATV